MVEIEENMTADTVSIKISGSNDVSRMLNTLKSYMLKNGFVQTDVDEVIVAASELGTNMYKYADHGELKAMMTGSGDRVGIQVEAADNGPGISDTDMALTDGYSTGGSLGYGLGTVNRIMDDLRIDSELNKGTKVTAVRWRRTNTPAEIPCPYEIGIATRPYPGMTINGDSYVIKKYDHFLLVSVIDGLGHGQYAFRASQKAREYIEKHYLLSLADIFRGVGKSCFGTRGVVIAVARFDWKSGSVEIANVGNIEIKVFRKSEWKGCIVRRGIVGVNAPRPVVEKRDWDADGIFIMQSDGIGTRWDQADILELYSNTAFVNAREILMKYGKSNDDATVIVVKGRKDD